MADKDDAPYLPLDPSLPLWRPHRRLYDPRGAAFSEFFRGMEFITHPDDSRRFMLSRDSCGPYIGLPLRVLGPEFLGHGAIEVLVGPSVLTDPELDGPARRLALERLRQEQEKDRQAGVQYPDRCMVPTS